MNGVLGPARAAVLNAVATRLVLPPEQVDLVIESAAEALRSALSGLPARALSSDKFAFRQGACSDAIVLVLAMVSAAKENVYMVGAASKPSQYLRRGETGGR